MSKLKMNCGYCGRKCDLDKDFCIPQDSVYVCKACYEWQNRVDDLESKLAESEKNFVVANNLRKNSDEVLLNYKTEKYALDKTIQELRKIKLSMPEKEWYYKGFENCERQMSSHIADLTLEVKQLKQQLAEKDKNNKLLEAMISTLPEHDKELEELHNQDKISFCVEQLGKMKENLIEDLFDLYRSPCLIYETYGDEYDSAIQEAINNTIDNQIKQLKEGK